jgi:DNA-binding transcriptional ArsR family regulator
MDHLSAAGGRVPGPVQDADSEPAGSADDVFKALADPSRRLLLDSLFADDGQTLGDLSARLPGMTRFGVMKHLRLLEAAGLVTTHKIGREKLHYLNPVPIRLIHDRWTSKYAEPWVGGLADLHVDLDEPATRDMR